MPVARFMLLSVATCTALATVGFFPLLASATPTQAVNSAKRPNIHQTPEFPYRCLLVTTFSTKSSSEGQKRTTTNLD